MKDKKLREKVQQYIKENPGVDALDIAQHFGLDLAVVGEMLNQMIEEGNIKWSIGKKETTNE